MGKVRVSSYQYGAGYYDMYGVRGYSLVQCLKPIRVTNLKIRGQVWMVDDPAHWYAMQEHAEKYSGHVLCAGLGLGLIVYALNTNPRVTKITVIEREKDVIKMIKPWLPKEKLQVLHGDFWDLEQWVMDPVNGVLFDLFVGNGRELMTQAIRVRIMLREKFPKADVIRIHGFNNEQMDDLDRLIDMRL